jgi:hypothetical protein
VTRSEGEGWLLFALPEVRRQIRGGLPSWVVMQSASGGKLTNEELQSEAEKGALWISGISVAAGCWTRRMGI